MFRLTAGRRAWPATAASPALPVRTLAEVAAAADTGAVAAARTGRPVIGLALGGGGLRGYAHVGVLQALEEAGIEAKVVTGTSAGSVIGAAYASGRTAADIHRLAQNLDVGTLTDWRLSKASLMRGEALTTWVSTITGNTPIEHMPRRFGAAATGIDSGESLLIDRGDAGLAVRASAAVPGAMQPVASARGPLIDGGISSVVPVRFARAMGAGIVIGVDIYCSGPRRQGDSLLTTIARVPQTQTCLVSQQEMAEADVLIRPGVQVDDMASAAQREAAIEAGYRAAKAALPKIRGLARL